MDKFARQVLGGYADHWLDAENPQLGGATPRDVARHGPVEESSQRTAGEEVVRDLLRGIVIGST